jgi:ABC-2 type transport system ATP-binding protein
MSAFMFIELHHISRTFGNNQALIDVSLSLEKGRIGLLGPNGAGKSTLMKILLGLLPPSSGTGRVLDHSLASAGIELRRAIGYMSEADALVPGMQGAEYVALAGELYGMSRKQALRRAHEVLTYLDLGEARYRKLEEYSTGMRQRLKLAQALVHDPPVLLLDEPTSGMDPDGREKMLDLLLKLGKEHGKSLLLSTHLLGDIDKVCDAVVILHQGRILCQGPVRQLCRRRHDRYRLQIQGEPNPLLDDLRLEGVKILHDNGRGEFRVQVPEAWTTQAFFKLAQVHNLVVRGIQADDEDLEELFHRVIQETQAPP